MSIRRIHGSWWVDFRAEGIRYRKRSPEDSQTGARAYELLLRQRVARAEPLNGYKTSQDPAVLTFREFSEKWFTTYVVTNNKPSSQYGKRASLRAHLVPFFGKMRLTEITSLHIEQFKSAKLESGLSPQTINKHLNILGKCLRCAEEWDELKQVPRMKLLKVPPRGFDFLSQDESEKLLASIEDPVWHTLILIALRTGLRVSELLGLEWPDIDFNRQLLCLRKSLVRGVFTSPKNNRERFIPLTPQVCHALEQIRKPSGLLFCNKKGRPFSYYKVRKRLIRVCEQAGIRPIGWHKLRHTFASHLVAAGVSLKATQELLGHSSISMTLRYAHLAPSALRSAVQVLDSPQTEKVGQPVGNA